MSLSQYIIEHSKRLPSLGAHGLSASENKSLSEMGANVVFFVVALQNNPTPEALRGEIEAYYEVNSFLNIFDGKEHSYLDVGVWLADQRLALQLMGMGALLNLWGLLTPYTIYGPSMSREQALLMAGDGLISIFT